VKLQEEVLTPGTTKLIATTVDTFEYLLANNLSIAL